MSHRSFQLDDNGDSSSQDLLSITKNIGPLLDRATRGVFLAHAQKLMTESVDYIIPAVWGAKKDGTLDETQQEIACPGQIIPLWDRESQDFSVTNR